MTIVRQGAAALFWKKVDTRSPNECWEWKGPMRPKGYGSFTTGLKYGLSSIASRVAWQLTNGDPGDLVVCHSCDNPACCNPSHMWLGTRADNNKDMDHKGRARRPAIKGEANAKAKLTNEDVVAILKDPKGATALGRYYGVNRNTIMRIRNGSGWKHITIPFLQQGSPPNLAG